MILNKEQLREEAHKLALDHDPFISRKRLTRYWRVMEDDLLNLRNFISNLREEHSTCAQPAEEWLLDNAEFLEEQAEGIKLELSRKLENSLPHLSKTGESRVFSICTHFIKHTNGNVTYDSLVDYLKTYQKVSILKMAEVWAIPLIMRIALFRSLTNVMDTVKERRDICGLVEKILSGIETSEITPEKLKQALEDSGQEMPLSGPLIVHLVKHLRERADYSATVGEWLICKLENGPESLDQILSYEYQVQAGYQVTTGNIITSIRKISRLDWKLAFEEISIVEQTLKEESAGTYPKMDFSSRNTIRNRIAQLSVRINLPENLIAQKAVELAETFYKETKQRHTSDEKPSHVTTQDEMNRKHNQDGSIQFDGSHSLNEDKEIPDRQAFLAYYLFEAVGIKKLRQALKLCGKPRAMPETGLLRRPTGTYFNMLAVLFVTVLVFMGLFIGGDMRFTTIEWSVILLVLAVPASEWAINVAHWLIEKTKRPVPLLRYDFSKGIPKEATAVVVIPVIWSTIEEVEEMADRLELHYLANRDKNLQFAILSDFADSEKETLPQDDFLVKEAVQQIQDLNQKYSDTQFFLLQRKRQWNEAEGVWMGWERKRGKLVEFVELLKGKKETSFTVIEGELNRLHSARYIITLDADTQLPLESAHRMIGSLHLPYNRPRLNKTKTRVISGYGVLQPRIGMSHEAAMKSRLAGLWSAEPGIDPYAFAISDPYQDGLGQGIFTGKGIFDINAFYEVLCERIPDNRVLSHDLLEGGFLRAGLLSDIELIDHHPSRFSAYQRRQHRWIRGDWQLLLWLKRKANNRNGELMPVDLSILTRWQIIDNIRRSLLAPLLFLMLVLAMTVLPGLPLRWIFLGAVTWLLPVIFQIINIRSFYKQKKGLLFTIGQVFVTIVTFPFQIALTLDAIGRSLFRLFFTKRKLLEWVPSSEEDRKSQQNGAPALYGMFGGYLLIAIFAGASLLQENVIVLAIGLLLSVLWSFAPAIIRWLDQQPQTEQSSFSSKEREELRNLAKEIWAFYENYVTEEENWLPPDNVQIEPHNGVAHRTSPTNIGLYLSCALAARDFEFINTPGLIERMERTIETLERMEKWEGHLYNWYDTETLRPLSPRYVSTVDSGNLVGCLITVKEGLQEWLKFYDCQDKPTAPVYKEDSLKIAFAEEITPPNTEKLQRNQEQLTNNWKERGNRLLERLENLISATDFRPLYDHQATLFSLGYHVDRDERDDILYDLMASEARIASFVAIALGQVSVSHWHTLGRTMTKVGKRQVLLSWSGTMFEYLMPWLFMRTYQNTLWKTTYEAVVNRQIQYAEQRGVPFGISESGYYAFDFQMNYQYQAFGVPGLGFKRGLEQDLVVAPYATILALPFAKQKSLTALKKIEQLKGRGAYGFYEALDFTKQRLPKDKQHMVIQSFMAHHQGMSMLTLANLLLPKKIYERFHRNKQVRSAELLLQERIPKTPKYIQHPALKTEHKPVEKMVQDISAVREFTTHDTKTPEVTVLSNGEFTSVVTNTGSGFTQYKGLAVSRWREDPVMDSWGSYIYIRDLTKDRVWSPSYQPCRVNSEEGRVRFGLDKATFMREDEDVKTSMEICVSPEWNAEVRRISIMNTAEETKVFEVTTFIELALSNPIADAAHTAFSKLFIRTAFDAQSGCLIAGRRPREVKDQTLWAAHSLLVDEDKYGTVEYDTDRTSFIGRGYRLSEPQSIRSRLRGKVGSVADPVFVMRRRISIEPGEQVQLTAVTSVSETREEAIEIVQRFNHQQAVEHAFHLAWNRGQIELRNLHLTNREATNFQVLAGQVLYGTPLRDERVKHILANVKGQSGLWPHGVSGDRPVMLVRIDNQSHMAFVIKILTGHEYLRRLGLFFDLVLLNESEEGYHQHLQEALRRAAEHGVDRFGSEMSGVYVIAANQLEEEDKMLIMSVARVVLKAGGPSFRSQLRLKRAKAHDEQGPEWLKVVSNQEPQSATEASSSLQLDDTKDWQFFNGWGGFSPDGKEYRLLMKNNNYLPSPWINVLANPKFGCFVSELGTGYTWWRNSRECKLTPWSNDPVLDPPTETSFLRDEESGEVWSVTPPALHCEQPYRVTHARGFSKFEHERSGLQHEMTVFVPLEDPVKIIKLRLKNRSEKVKSISITYYAEWVLGVQRQNNAPFIVTEWNEAEQIMLAQNKYQEKFRDATAFLGIFPQPSQAEQAATTNQPNRSGSGSEEANELSWTADRQEFIGRNRSLEDPIGLERVHLSNRTGTFHEPCGAIQRKVDLMPNGERVVYILLGCEDSKQAVQQLANKYREGAACDAALKEVTEFWKHHLEQITVSTPSQEMNTLLNGWLLYQSLGCRMWARTAFYQAGGAFGFRDQLQDSLALLHTMPEKTRAQIILNASHQYLEGDVQHWWHEETEKGIRTLFSDDLLWMPYAVSRYIEHTGDQTILDELAPFLYSEPLREGEHERYEATVRSDESASIYEHCIRAINLGLQRIGEHGLPLIGVGDWNDGMNLVGAEGRGESVWLGWFICDILQRFVPISEARGDNELAEKFHHSREQLISALNEHGWDGQWYRRAFTDSGQWLGTIQNEECRIDAIAQSWSVISGGAPSERAVQAMNSFDRELVERDLSVIRLLTPPFDNTEPSPGYIQGYPPGLRENGAQYTHGVIWGIIAWCQLNNGDKALEMFNMLNPMNHTRTNLEVKQYTGEPYVMAADVYTASPNEGHSGWTWYTGASGWMYQAGIEWILGIRRRADQLYVNPRIPKDWPGFSATYRFETTRYMINVKNESGQSDGGISKLLVDGKEVSVGDGSHSEGAIIPIQDDGQEHVIEITI